MSKVKKGRIDFWHKICLNNKPFFATAPMADVTDYPFRQMIAKYSRHGKVGGGPDVFFTEFVSADGLASKEGKKKLLFNLKFSKNEKPIVAQIFGSNPEKIKIACEIIYKLGFDGVDINMGCPDRKILKQGAGADLIRSPKLAREIIKSAIAGVKGKIPVSVKTRIGFNKIEYKEWLSEILKEDISALTIHLRTKKELSKVSAHWELAKEIVDFVKTTNKNVVLIGNGDVATLEQGRMLAKKSGFDGIMIGRGIFGNPWFFDSKRKSALTVREKFLALKEQIKIFDKELLKKNHKNFDVIKKHFKAYINGFPASPVGGDGAKDIRAIIMQAKNPNEAEKIIDGFIKTLI